ncbi:NRAMP family divalent metal transporter [Rhodothermus profundi]|uniref:NRAMP (Natural resistance-associated macrophage protein) metal ion transporters n=1 Tax=Rhodothermus profundi TaxID=633813 RepID=A0A1M6WFT1_9BACT|nr:divalent metal cation transporter [Rhodothermus profundi]SHK92642.1 NRAMP (natural resistance-associated macrophage protein) metal ion transporters [Rhodothermus profundi]
MKRWTSILLGAVLTAAFIGPGTVTTAAAAGAHYGLALLWALTFSTLACWTLQEAAARLAICSGLPLAEALRHQFDGWKGVAVRLLALGAIVLGNAAFEVGNVLGAVAGLELVWPVSRPFLVIGIGLLSGALLWFGTLRMLPRVLGAFVAFMGLAFLVTALKVHPLDGALLHRLVWPSLPEGAGLLVIGLIGTTVVPYNLFLGSGLAQGEQLNVTRFGLTVAIVGGGLISMAILVVGTAVQGAFTYEALADTLGRTLGDGARVLFALGLFAAGFTSALTAPIAAAITARGLLADPSSGNASEPNRTYRITWLVVWGSGITLSLLDLRPIPAIITAQALNGVLLPVVAVFLWIATNDPRLMGRNGLTSRGLNLLTGISVGVAVLLGLRNLLAALQAAGIGPPLSESLLLKVAGGLTLVLLLCVSRYLYRLRRLRS